MAEYIERDKVIRELEWYIERFPDCAECLETRKHIIAYIPAADVRPVVRGKWEESVDQLQANCSVCKTSFPCWRIWPANFCPNCGADMRGPVND